MLGFGKKKEKKYPSKGTIYTAEEFEAGIRVIKAEPLTMPVEVDPGDTMELRYSGLATGLEEVVVSSTKVDVKATYRDAMIFEAKNCAGMKDGLGGVFCNMEDVDL